MSKWIEKELGELYSYEQPYKYIVENTDYDKKSGIPVLTAGKSFILGYTKETDGVYSNLPVIIFDDFTTECKYVDFPFKVKSSAMKFLKAKNDKSYFLPLLFAYLETLKLFEVGEHKRQWLSEYTHKIVYLPEDIEEQKRIAAILSKADELIEATQTLIDKQKKVKTGLMQTLLTSGIDDNGVIRSPKTHKFKDSELGPIPEEWQCVELGRLSNMCLGKMLDSKKNKGKNKFYLRNENVQWQYFDMLDLDQMPFEGHEIERYSIRKGDVVMCEGGEPGRCAVWDADNVEMYFQKALHRIRCKKALYNHFLVYEFMYLNMNNVLSDYFTGTTIMHLTGMSLDKFLIKIPSLPEQDRIVSVLQQQDQIIKDLENEKQKYIDIKKGLMADLLTGKVKVMA